MVVFADATSVKMDYLPTGFARVDPILRDDCLSDHVRKYSFYQSVTQERTSHILTHTYYRPFLFPTPSQTHFTVQVGR